MTTEVEPASTTAVWMGPAVTSATASPPGPPGPPTRVVLADDAILIREAVAGLLESGGFEVVAQVGDPVALRSAVAATHPAVAVVDIRMPPTRVHSGVVLMLGGCSAPRA